MKTKRLEQKHRPPTEWGRELHVSRGTAAAARTAFSGGQWLEGVLCALLVVGMNAAGGPLPPERSRPLADLSIEELMNESVTSVSKKETKLSDSPAAIT